MIADDPAIPQVGDLFEGKYEIRGILGRGGSAAVLRAFDTLVQREVALKILAPLEGAVAGNVEARFVSEAKLISQLQDPHTIRMYEFGRAANGRLFMAFQYVAGVDLAATLARQRSFEPATAVHVARQIASALAEAHAIGVLHRDVKPHNILIHEYMGDAYAAKLLDFGIARAIDHSVQLTRTGAMVGSPRYMSPEQVFTEELTAATDVYSLGLVLAEMVYGRTVTGDHKASLERIAAGTPVELPMGVVAPQLRAVIQRMTQMEPDMRYPDGGAVLQALEQLAHLDLTRVSSSPLGAPGVAPPRVVEPEPQVGATAQSSPRPSTVAAVLVAAAAVATSVGGYVLNKQAQSNAPPLARRVAPPALVRAPAPAPEKAVLPALDAGNVRALPDVGFDMGPNGCGRNNAGLGAKTFVVEGGREVGVLLPQNYDPNYAHPVVVTFHQKYKTHRDYLNDAGWMRMLQSSESFIILAPFAEDSINPWDDKRGEAFFAQAGLQAASREFCIDRTRIFAAGHHDGGRMARYLACWLPLSGLALSGYSERTDREWCEPHQPVPVIWIVGRDDPFIPVEGGKGCTSGRYRSHADYDRLWHERNGCTGDPVVWENRGGARCETWQCGAAYVSCRTPGGHHLDDTELNILFPKCHTRTIEFDVAAHAWRFFRDSGRTIDPGAWW